MIGFQPVETCCGDKYRDRSRKTWGVCVKWDMDLLGLKQE